jgi:hypothetical protein
MAIHGSTVELYDGRRKSSRWYDLRQIEKGEYAVTTTGKMSKETMVSFDEGDFVYLGIVAGKMGEQPTPELPGRELYRKVLSATTEQRNRRIARAFPWAK